MRAYELRRGHAKNLEGDKLKTIAAETFGSANVEDGKVVASFGAISQVECLGFADQISAGYASWKRRSSWKMYWDPRAGRTAAIGTGTFQPGLRVPRGADTIRFVAGEIGGPWGYLH